MRILCVCKSGNVRSVTLARLLRERGHEAIGVGLKQHGVMMLLSAWAERIYAMDSEVAQRLLAELPAVSGALVSTQYAVGLDDWKVPDHPDLLRRLRDMVEAHPPE